MSYLTRELVRDEQFFPALVQLRTPLPPGTSLLLGVRNQIMANFRTDYPAERDALGRVYDARLLQGRVVLFLDGWDEAPAAEQAHLNQQLLESTKLGIGENRLILSSRSARNLPTALSVPIYELLPLSEEQLGQVPEDIPQKLERIGSTTDSPSGSLNWMSLSLSFLTFMPRLLGWSLKNLPNLTPMGVFRTYVNMRLKDQPYRQQIELILRRTARKTQGDAMSFDYALVANATSEVVPPGSADLENIINAVLQSEFITLVEDSAPPQYRFTHASLKELFAAAEISSQPNPVAEIIRTILDPRTADTQLISLVTSELNDADQGRLHETLSTFPESLDFQILRARTRCVGEASAAGQQHIDKLADDLARWLTEPTRYYDDLRLLGSRIHDSRRRLGFALMSRLKSAVENPDPRVRGALCVFLGAARLAGTVQLLSPLLLAPENDLREAAAEALGEGGDKAAIPVLQEAYLNSPGSFVFQPAAWALGKLGRTSEEAVQVLVGILQDQKLFRNVRWPAAAALGLSARESAVTPLIQALTDQAGPVRSTAAEALGNLKAGPAIDPLSIALTDSDVTVRVNAAKALEKIGVKTDALVEGLSKVFLNDDDANAREAAAITLRVLAPESSLKLLRDALKNARPELKMQAIELLARQAGAEALEPALQLSDAPEAYVRDGAARALRIIPGDRSANRLLELLRDKSKDVRWTALDGLNTRRYTPALPEISRCAESDPDTLVQDYAVRTLGTLRDPAATPILIKILQGGTSAAALALGTLGDPTAIPALASGWLLHRDVLLSDWYTTAIGRIGGPDATRTLRELLTGARPQDVLPIARGIHALQGPSAIPALLSLLDKTFADNEPATEFARFELGHRSRPQLVTGLELALGDGDPTVRRHAAIWAPFYSNSSMTQTLRKLSTSDPDVTTAAAARDALLAIDRKSAALGNTNANTNDGNAAEIHHLTS
jgi:HEAT repeat protein